MIPDTFHTPLALTALLLVPALIALYLITQKRRRQHAVRFAATPMLASVLPATTNWPRHLIATGALLAFTATIIAAASPQGTTKVPKEQAAIILAVDVSLSMEANDVQPNRITAAKQAATTFVESVPENLNIGLVLFAGTATVAVPATQDHDQILNALNTIELGESTAIGEAIFASLQALQTTRLDTTGDQKIPQRIILLSDGTTTIGRPDALAATAAQQAGVPVDTVALGTAKGTIMYDGQRIPVPVAEKDLRQIATTTNGKFFAADSLTDVKKIYGNIGSVVGYETKKAPIAHRWALLAALLFAASLAGAWTWSGRLN